LSESLIKTVKEGDEEEEINDEIERARAAFSKSILLLSPDVKDDDKDKNDGKDKDEDKDKDDDEEEKEEEQKTPEQKEEKEETTTEASPENNQTKSLMQTLIKPKEVIHDFNCFNRIWTKRYESIYFYKIKNNYHKEE
jgi:hypothetical protein